jgi:uncharacterized protein
MMTESFTPLRGIIGGGLIGLTAAVLLLFNGNVFGCSGIASSVVVKPSSVMSPENSWKIVLLASFFVSSSILSGWAANDPRLYSDDPSVPIPSSAAYLLGGFFVSFGASLGSGCTTGHGVCGMARLSGRSFVRRGRDLHVIRHCDGRRHLAAEPTTGANERNGRILVLPLDHGSGERPDPRSASRPRVRCLILHPCLGLGGSFRHLS